MTKMPPTDDIELLLENSMLDPNGHFSVDDKAYAFSGITDRIIQSGKTQCIVQQQTIDISKIYYQQGAPAQAMIVAFLVASLDDEREEFVRTIANVLFQIGTLEKLISQLRLKFKDADQKGYANALDQLNRIICIGWEGMHKTEIRSLREWCGNVLVGSNDLGEDLENYFDETHVSKLIKAIHAQTNRILVLDVRQRIELGFNPEINEDEAKLKEGFTKFGFPKDLSQALDKIDQKLSASKDAFDFKGCMDLLRSFTERLYRSILDQYGEEGKKIHEQSADEVATFFKKKGLVGENFGDMIVSQRHFLSNLASHRLKSREEDARLSKNMIIEMSLYLLRRFQLH
jgi:hypothetical protein